MLIAQIGFDEGVENMFRLWGHDVRVLHSPLKNADGIDLEPDLVVFTGGSDVTPFLYNQKNTDSHCDIRRDIEEMMWYHKFKHAKKLGICRGGQFLNVMEGGSMHQDILGHAIGDTHELYFIGVKYKVTSTHHQGMIADERTVIDGLRLVSIDAKPFYELLWYRNAICFQPHPEYEAEYANNNTQGLLRRVLREYYQMEII